MLKPPAYVPLTSVNPDIPGTEEVLPGYFHYPSDPPTYTTGDIGTGSPVTALLQGDVPVNSSGNKWWRMLNEKANVDLKITQVQARDYGAKLTVTVAGGDLPDMMQTYPIPNLGDILEAKFADLSDYIGGDNVKQYPGLAALPPTAWTAGTVNGRIYGISQPRATAHITVLTRQSILDDLGIDASKISDGQDYLALCKELTSRTANRWAFGIQPASYIVFLILEMMGAPNGWSVDAGNFTSAYETDFYADALETVRAMWSAGYIRPESFTSSGGAYLSWWLSGNVVFYPQAFDWWCGYQKLYPDMPIGAIAPPKWDGGGDARKMLGPGNYRNYVALKKAPKSRIEELLRLWDYLAAPFGTQEFLDVNYGVLGHDYTLNGGDPEPTKISTAEYLQGLIYVGSTGYSVIYVPGNEAVVRDACAYLERMVPDGISDPTDGLYSETALGKGVSAKKALQDLMGDIIQGRKPVSAWDEGVAAWRKSAGDKMRSEYQASYASTHS